MLEFLRDIFTGINGALDILLSETLNLPPAAVLGIQNLLGVMVVSGFGLVLIIFTIWIERLVAGRMLDRFGPNRVGPYGL